MNELKALFQELGWDHEPEDLKEAATKLDKDSNGTIEFDEFLKFATVVGQSRINERYTHIS